jgi:peptide/nickel transport system permease protein
VARLSIIYRHALRNALLPTIAFLGIYMASLLGGAVIIEVVFARRGWGRILVNAMNQHDYPVIQGGILAFSVIVVLVNLAVDLMYAWVDPRISYS